MTTTNKLLLYIVKPCPKPQTQFRNPIGPKWTGADTKIMGPTKKTQRVRKFQDGLPYFSIKKNSDGQEEEGHRVVHHFHFSHHSTEDTIVIQSMYITLIFLVILMVLRCGKLMRDIGILSFYDVRYNRFGVGYTFSVRTCSLLLASVLHHTHHPG